MTYPSWEEIRKSHRFTGRDIPMILPDMPSFMALPIARNRDDAMPARTTSAMKPAV